MDAGNNHDEPTLSLASGKWLPHLLKPLHPGVKAEPVPRASPLPAAHEMYLGSIFFLKMLITRTQTSKSATPVQGLGIGTS